jgi:G3E family GTPase
VTKPDLVEEDVLDELERRLEAVNPLADVLRALDGVVDPELLLERRRGTFQLASLGRQASARPARHEDGVIAIALELDAEIDWTAFGVWLTMLLQARGPEVLRVKGLLDVGGDGPLLVNCVQHAVHPPVHLEAWPDGDRRSRLIVIGRGLDSESLDRSLRAFDRAARA